MALFDWFSPKNRGRIMPNFQNTVGEWLEDLNDRVTTLEESSGNTSESTLQTLSDRISVLENMNLTDRVTIQEDNIQQLISKENTMAIDLSALVSAVTNEKTQESSLRTLVSQLSTTVASMAANVVDDNTKSQLADLAAQINAQSAEIVNAVTANTPATNGGSTPTPTPTPAPVVNPNATPAPAPVNTDPNAVPGGTVPGPAPAPAPTNNVPPNPLAGNGTSNVTATTTPAVGTPVVNPNAAPGTDPTATTVSTSNTPAAPAGSGTSS